MTIFVNNNQVLRRDGNGDIKTLGSSINAVIVGVADHFAKVWYGRGSDKPDCWSSDGKRPDISVPERQNKVCALCPRNAWGSALSKNYHRSKACGDYRRIALVVLGEQESPVHIFVVSPSGISSFNKYNKEFISRGIGIHTKETRISMQSWGLDFTQVSNYKLDEMATSDSIQYLLNSEDAFISEGYSASRDIPALEN